MAGVLRLLPLYAADCHPIILGQSIIWAQAQRGAQRRALPQFKKRAKPATWRDTSCQVWPSPPSKPQNCSSPYGMVGNQPSWECKTSFDSSASSPYTHHVDTNAHLPESPQMGSGRKEPEGLWRALQCAAFQGPHHILSLTDHRIHQQNGYRIGWTADNQPTGPSPGRIEVSTIESAPACRRYQVYPRMGSPRGFPTCQSTHSCLQAEVYYVIA